MFSEDLCTGDGRRLSWANPLTQDFCVNPEATSHIGHVHHATLYSKRVIAAVLALAPAVCFAVGLLIFLRVIPTPLGHSSRIGVLVGGIGASCIIGLISTVYNAALGIRRIKTHCDFGREGALWKLEYNLVKNSATLD